MSENKYSVVGDKSNRGMTCGNCKCHDLCLSGIQTNCVLNGDKTVFVEVDGKTSIDVVNTKQ